MVTLALALIVGKTQVGTSATGWSTVDRLTALIGKDADAVHQTLGDPVEIVQGQAGDGPAAVDVARFYYAYDTKVPNADRLNVAIVIRKSDRKAIGVQGEARSSRLSRDGRNWEACKAAMLGAKPWRPLRAYVRPIRIEQTVSRCDGGFFALGTRADGQSIAMRLYNPEVTIVQSLVYNGKALDFDRTWVWGPTFDPVNTDVQTFSIGIPLESQAGVEPPESGTLVTLTAV